jgi:fructan beta-fructosidase
MRQKTLLLFICAALLTAKSANAEDISVRITKKYLNIPVSHQVSRSVMTFEVDGRKER